MDRRLRERDQAEAQRHGGQAEPLALADGEAEEAVGHDGEIRIADRIAGFRAKWGVFKLRRGVSATAWDRVGTYTFTSKRNCVAFINTHWGHME